MRRLVEATIVIVVLTVLTVGLAINKAAVSVKISPTVENTAPKVIPGVVHVMCPEWQGSGFVVGPRLIVTARHVVEGVTDFTITTHNGHKLHATRAISFKNRDVGFIWIDDLKCVSEVERELECSKVKHEVTLQVLELGSIKECSLGQPIFAIGSPYGKVNFNHLSSGIISALDRNWDELGEDYGWEIGWTTTVAGHPGNSGCPILTLDGRVRGVLVGGFSPVLVLAMPVDLFLDHLDEVTLMFEMDNYKREQPKDTRLDEIYEWFLQHRKDNRIDELYQWFLANKDDKRLDELYEWFLANKCEETSKGPKQ